MHFGDGTGCFVYGKKGPLVIYDEGQKSRVDYVKVLKQHLLPFLESNPQPFWERCVLFQQDNAPIHTAMVAQFFFLDNGIACLPWPAQSPDLNPIELVWAWMKHHVGKQHHGSCGALIAAIHEAWEAIPSNYLKSLIWSMPHRMHAVIAAKGLSTKYSM